ncbi:MAG: c-type cytochrome [Edaphobacter sp.]
MNHRQQRTRLLRMTAICLCAGFFFVLSLGAATKPNPMTQENVKRGNTLFQQSCAMCHGAGAMGGSGANLIGSSLVRHDENGNLIGGVVRDGRPEKGMPPFPSMTPSRIADIAAFLHARIQVTSSVNAKGPVGGYSLQRLLTGNIEEGRKYFNGEGRCATCHSPTGDLAGIAGRFGPEELEAQFLYPRNSNVTATVLLPSGKKIKGKLLHLDAFYVAIVDESGWYHSWPLDKVKTQLEDPLAGHRELLGRYKDKDIHNVFSYLETLK